MSNALAIAAVTATLSRLLDRGLPADTKITTQPPNKARSGDGKDQINLFLYQVSPNAAWRNMDMPRQVKPNETGHPPLALDLFYLLTAYGKNDEDLGGHQVLGQGMSIFHDHPLLGAAEIEAALEGNDLHRQVERIRITPYSLSLEDLSKLWATFQTEYRISTAYQVSVVLIESTRPAKAPLPILSRGQGDQGPTAQAGLTPPYPTLTAIRLPNEQPSAHLGDDLIAGGHHLQSSSLIARFSHPLLTAPREIGPLPGVTTTGPAEITIPLPNQPGQWPAGFYTLALVVKVAGQPDRTTNELSFSLAPRITNKTVNSIQGGVRLTITCSPEIRPGQRAVLLLGDREIPAQPQGNQPNRLEFQIKPAPSGEHFIRLRVDGVDSLLVNRAVSPPVFDETQKVTIP
jgi:hypothetical protein